jgi:hypothetical protein
MWGHSEGDA